MIKKIENSPKYSSKRKTLSIIGSILLDKGYEPEFVAGILANIYHEGKIGYFESSNYKSNPSLKPDYLEYMDNVYNYATKYSGKSICDVSMKEVGKMMEELNNINWKGKFGLGCVQWTGDRSYT